MSDPTTDLKSEKPALECCICYDKAQLPVHSCDNHIACYECLWRTTTNSSTVDYSNDQIVYSASCPSCRKNKIIIHDGREGTEKDSDIIGYPSLQGIRPLANIVLDIFFPEPIKCPFCSCQKPATAMLGHVQRCSMRPLQCPRQDCNQTIFYTKDPWSHHTRNVCCRVECQRCDFKASYDQVQHHTKLHHVAETLAKRLNRLSDHLQHFHVSEEPEIGALLTQEQAEKRLNTISNWLGDQNHHLLQRVMMQPLHLS